MHQTLKILLIASFLGSTLGHTGSLHTAAKTGDIAKLTELLNTTVQIDELDAEGCSALHVAIGNNHVEFVKKLMRANATVDIKAFLHATQNSQIVEELLKAKTDINGIYQPAEGPKITIIRWAKIWNQDKTLSAIRRFSIENQIPISDEDDINMLGDSKRYKEDFEVYGHYLKNRRSQLEQTKLPMGLIIFIEEYSGHQYELAN